MSDPSRLRERPATNPPPGMERAGARFGAREREIMPPLPPRSEPRHAADEWQEWPPVAGSGPLVGGLLIAVTLVVALLAGWQLRGSDGALKGVWLLIGVVAFAGAAYTAYLLRGLGTLRYIFTDDALLVRWMREEQALRYDDVLGAVYRPRDVISLAARERFWPGYYVSVVQRPEGVWRSYATETPGRRVRLHGPDGILAISPHRPVRFREELERRCGRQLGAGPRPAPAPVATPLERPSARETAHQAPERAAPPERVQRPSQAASGASASGLPTAPALNRALVEDVYRTLFRGRLLGDQFASTAIALGVLLPLLMAGYLFSQYEGVPRAVPLHWDAHGYLDRIGTPRELWVLPLTCAVILVVNTALATYAIAFDRFAARLLTAATPIAQLAAFVALVWLVS
jgi:hypothetical protein